METGWGGADDDKETVADNDGCGGVTDNDGCAEEDSDVGKRDDGDCADGMWGDCGRIQGQQQITSYFKSKEKIEIERKVLEDMENPEGYETSDIVIDDEGRKRLILLGSDVVGLFPAMTDVSQGGLSQTK